MWWKSRKQKVLPTQESFGRELMCSENYFYGAFHLEVSKNVAQLEGAAKWRKYLFLCRRTVEA